MAGMLALESLSLKRNKIASLDGLDQGSGSLVAIDLEGNQLSSMSEVLKLSQLSRATTVSLVDNEGLEDDYRSELLAAMSNLTVLDGEPFAADELAEAAAARRTRAEEAAAAVAAAAAEAAVVAAAVAAAAEATASEAAAAAEAASATAAEAETLLMATEAAAASAPTEPESAQAAATEDSLEAIAEDEGDE
jgi:hypothetical protein